MVQPVLPGPLILLPLVIICVTLLVLAWCLRWLRLPDELEPYVLEALSEADALPSWEVRKRSPLAERDVDIGTLIYVLERLREKGLVTRWYAEWDVPGPKQTVRRTTCPVYRRMAQAAAGDAA